ncbi:hypothetical protein HK101_010834 [Irineochytrium annulatum]|nr:hypothetical protein HK101_010834 [Irineochytrium annulatum]
MAKAAGERDRRKDRVFGDNEVDGDDDAAADFGWRKKGENGRKTTSQKVEGKHRDKSMPHGATKQVKTKPSKMEMKKDVLIPEGITVIGLASLLQIPYQRMARSMEQFGFTENSTDFVLNSESASLIAMELGFNPVVSVVSQVEKLFVAREEPTDWTAYPLRSPVVTIMGHVDHGKTTLLDTLRRSSVAAGEAGGITQHIGAFSVKLGSGRQITFLDTPGHAAFTAMRERGARVTDIVVLVVAADDGVMPQTIEAIKHTRAAKVQMIVAINKCDKPGVNPSKIKEELLKHEVILEDYGGEIPAVEVSGLTGKGLDTLEDTIVTLAELSDIRGDPTGNVEGYVLESRMAKGRGSVATVLVKRGTLKLGQVIVAGKCWCKVKSITDENGAALKEAGPSMPAEVTGWRDLPSAGDFALQANSEDHAKEVVTARVDKSKNLEFLKSIDDLNVKRTRRAAEKAAEEAAEKALKGGSTIASTTASTTTSVVKELNLVLKADVFGSLEALQEAISGLPSHEVKVCLVSAGVGSPSEGDIELAAAVKASVIAFNVGTDKKTLLAAKNHSVDVKEFKIIYELLDALKDSMSDLLPPEIVHEVVGEAEVLQIFTINAKSKKAENIAGCRVLTGKVARSAKIKLLRGGETLFDGSLKTLKHHKKDVNEAAKGLECGMALESFGDVLPGDRIVCYTTTSRKRQIS